MRDEFSDVDRDAIEIIDADDAVFGAAPSGRSEHAPTAVGHGPRRARQTALVLAGVAALVTGALLTWKPWADESPRLVLPDRRAGDPTLTEELVFDAPPADLHAATLAPESTGAGTDATDDMVGYLFGEPDATLSTSDGADRWVGFYAAPQGATAAPSERDLREGDRTTVTIDGAPGLLQPRIGGTTLVVWGPLDGMMYSATTSGLTDAETVSLAGSLRVDGENVVVDDPAALVGMEPIGSFYDYLTVTTLLRSAQDSGQQDQGVVGVYYGFRTQSVVSTPANESALGLVPFILSNRHHRDGDDALTVHGQPAVGFTKGAGPFGAFDITAVVWWEGGRLVMVTSTDDLQPTISLAETVRPASPQEWAAVEDVV